MQQFIGRLTGMAWRRGAIAVALALGLTAVWSDAPAIAQVGWDPAKLVGPAKCGECHKNENANWRETHHFKTFAALPRNKAAAKIAKAMGLKRIKSGSLCLDCHFTSVVDRGKPKPIAGISCESCHGPGRDFLKVHSSFSGKTEQTESPAEEEARWAKSVDAGMIRPAFMYRWAKNCYSCHVVPQEELVNKGGHPAGSAFELVAWSQGEIRHNLWYNGGKENAEADPNTKRKMFVVGMAVELETALRAVGKATQKASYAVAMAKRASRAAKRFEQAAKLLSVPEMDEIVAASKSAKLKLNNDAALSAAADKVADATRRLVAKYDGSTFSGIDKALPAKSKYKGKPGR